jgi:Domain of unknown function (DUF932)
MSSQFALRNVLNDAQIANLAPSVFATARHPAMSGRYAFISTAQVLDALRAEGFMPVSAKQAGARESARAGYARHILTFRLTDSPLIAGEDIPEIVLLNAHDGSTAYKLMVGVFCVICSNGLIVADRTLAAMRVAHVGTRTIAEVVTATHKLVAELPTVLGQVETWRSTLLSEPEQLAYARAALTLRYPGRIAPITPQQLLAARRPEDRGDNLWTVFNRVQEHLIVGGLSGQLVTGRRTTTRPIAAVSTSVALNRALWTLAARTAEGISVRAAIEVAELV